MRSSQPRRHQHPTVLDQSDPGSGRRIMCRRDDRTTCRHRVVVLSRPRRIHDRVGDVDGCDGAGDRRDPAGAHTDPARSRSRIGLDGGLGTHNGVPLRLRAGLRTGWIVSGSIRPTPGLVGWARAVHRWRRRGRAGPIAGMDVGRSRGLGHRCGRSSGRGRGDGSRLV